MFPRIFFAEIGAFVEAIAHFVAQLPFIVTGWAGFAILTMGALIRWSARGKSEPVARRLMIAGVGLVSAGFAGVLSVALHSYLPIIGTEWAEAFLKLAALTGIPLLAVAGILAFAPDSTERLAGRRMLALAAFSGAFLVGYLIFEDSLNQLWRLWLLPILGANLLVTGVSAGLFGWRGDVVRKRSAKRLALAACPLVFGIVAALFLALR